MTEPDMLKRFEEAVLPHLAAAYNLARWLTRNDHDAEDLVQEAYLRALKAFDGFRGGDGRAWLLTIVRNTCYTWLRQNRMEDLTEAYDEEIHTLERDSSNPETLLLASADAQLLRQALEELPVEFREVLVLREFRRNVVQGNRRSDVRSGGYRHVSSGPRPRAPSAAIDRFGEKEP